MKKIILGTVFCLTIAGAAGAIYYGNSPIKTYYPNGALKSEMPQKFFKKDGIYKEYTETAQIKLEVPYQNGVKSGTQKEYFSNGARLEIPYVNEQKEGTAHFYTKSNNVRSWEYKNNQLTGTLELPDGVNMSFLPDNRYEIIFPDNPKGVVQGTLLCDDSIFGKAFAQTNDIEQALVFIKCASIEHFNMSTPEYDMVFNGNYQFPRFAKKSVLDVTDKQNKVAEAYDTVAEMGNVDTQATQFLQSFVMTKSRAIFEDDNRNVTIEGLNNDGKTLSAAKFDLYDIPKLTEVGIQSAQKEQLLPELFDILKNISLTESTVYNTTGKPEMKFKGRFTPMLAQFSEDTSFDIFNTTEQSVIGIKGVDSGIRTTIAYPKTAQNLLSYDIIADLSYLKEIQSRLKTIKSPNEYQGLFMEIMFGLYTKAPKTVHIKNLTINDATGTQIITTDDISINWQKKQINGKVLVNSPRKGLITLTFGGVRPTVIIEQPNGEQNEIPLNNLPLAMKILGLEDTFQQMGETYIAQANELADSNQSIFFAGVKTGYVQAMNRHKYNEILDNASKYAIIAYTSQQNHAEMNDGDLSGFNMPQFCDTGLIPSVDNNCSINGATFDTAIIEANQTTIKINFDNQETCQGVASLAKIDDTTCSENSSHINLTVSY